MSGISGAEWNLATELVPNREEMAKVLELAKQENPRSTQVALAHSSSTMTEKYAHVVDQREKVNLVKAVL